VCGISRSAVVPSVQLPPPRTHYTVPLPFAVSAVCISLSPQHRARPGSSLAINTGRLDACKLGSGDKIEVSFGKCGSFMSGSVVAHSTPSCEHFVK
jgi:hypothetical protein